MKKLFVLALMAVLIAAALYALLTCLWQIWLQHRKDMA